MRRLLARLLILAAPSVPLGLRGQVANHISVSGLRGEARPEAGSAGGHPAGEGRGGPRPSAHPDLLLNWRPAPENRGWLNDFALAGAVDAWSEQHR